MLVEVVVAVRDQQVGLHEVIDIQCGQNIGELARGLELLCVGRPVEIRSHEFDDIQPLNGCCRCGQCGVPELGRKRRRLKDKHLQIELFRGFSAFIRGFSTVIRGFSTVIRGFSTVIRGFSTVIRGFSTVIRGFSTVVRRGFSTVVRRGFSTVVRRGFSTVVRRGFSTVVVATRPGDQGQHKKHTKESYNDIGVRHRESPLSNRLLHCTTQPQRAVK